MATIVLLLLVILVIYALLRMVKWIFGEYIGSFFSSAGQSDPRVVSGLIGAQAVIYLLSGLLMLVDGQWYINLLACLALLACQGVSLIYMYGHYEPASSYSVLNWKHCVMVDFPLGIVDLVMASLITGHHGRYLMGITLGIAFAAWIALGTYQLQDAISYWWDTFGRKERLRRRTSTQGWFRRMIASLVPRLESFRALYDPTEEETYDESKMRLKDHVNPSEEEEVDLEDELDTRSSSAFRPGPRRTQPFATADTTPTTPLDTSSTDIPEDGTYRYL